MPPTMSVWQCRFEAPDGRKIEFRVDDELAGLSPQGRIAFILEECALHLRLKEII